MLRGEIIEKAKNYNGYKLSFVDGAEWMQAVIIDKALEWIGDNYIDIYSEEAHNYKFDEGWRKAFIIAMVE